MKKENKTWFYKSILIVFIFAFTISCNKSKPPTVTTAEVKDVMSNTATSGGVVTSDGDAPVSARGICWSTSQDPTIDDSKTTDGRGTGSFISNITGLNSNTTYYIRAYASNNEGTSYGNSVTFTTTPTVSDIDGNLYHTVKIGTQLWMVENLKVTHYRNGQPIPIITDSTTWSNLAIGAFCNFYNTENNAKIYGRLYNWYAINDQRKIAPSGWHVPSDSEWVILRNYLGGANIAGGKLKETGIAHWQSPNTDATNDFGFTALPCGLRDSSGQFSNLGLKTFWWCANMNITDLPYSQSIYYDNASLISGVDNKSNGFSVRCIKD